MAIDAEDQQRAEEGRHQPLGIVDEIRLVVVTLERTPVSFACPADELVILVVELHHRSVREKPAIEHRLAGAEGLAGFSPPQKVGIVNLLDGEVTLHRQGHHRSAECLAVVSHLRDVAGGPG